MNPSFSEDPKDEPIEFDPREKESDEDDIYIAADKKGEDADEAEIKAAAPEVITAEDVSDIHYNKKGEEDGYTLSTTKAAHALTKKMRVAMSEESDKIFRFTGEIYKPDGSRLADMKLCQLLGDEVTIVKFKEVERRMKNTLLSSPVVFEPDPYLLAVKNGVIDLRTGKFRGFRQEDYLLEKLNVVYDPKARCPVFCGYMTSITNVIVDRLTLIDWFASHAIKLPIPYVMFLLGLGRNGKGIYEKLLKEFYGQCSFSDFKIDEPAKNNFAASKLFRKRGWIAAESNTTNKEPVLGTEFMKLITGNGVIDSDQKYSVTRAVFEPYTQITIDTNGMPKIRDKSIGWEERIVKLNLPYLFLAMLKEGDPQVKVADPDLFDKLTTQQELSGILNLIIYRAKEICKTKRITKRAGNEMIKEYSEQSNSIKTFLDTFCEYDSSLSGKLTEFAPIHEAFEKWCQLTVSEKVDEGYFGKQLKMFCGGFAPKKTKNANRKNVTLYRGLIFDEVAYKEMLTTLLTGFKDENVSSVPTESSDKSTDENSLLLSMSSVSLDKQWKDIIDLFSIIPIGGEFSVKKVQNLGTLKTTISGDPLNESLGVSTDDLKSETTEDNPEEPCAREVEGATSDLTEPGSGKSCKDASIPKKSAADLKHDKFMDGLRKHTSQQKRTCHICGYVSPHDLIQDNSSAALVGCYICTTCLISHRTRGKPAPVETITQTSLAY
jgi:putative DNA primase/helicase